MYLVISLFGFEGRIWDLIVSVPDHCLSFYFVVHYKCSLYIKYRWAPSSEFMYSSNPSWQILTAHAQPFRGARELAFCLKVPLDSLPVWASSGGSGETARMRRLAWTFAARIGDKYQIRLTRSIWLWRWIDIRFSCILHWDMTKSS